MCIIAWNWQPADNNSLILISNRDEFYDRSATALHYWYNSGVLAGKDLVGGGTWLGVNHFGRLAALTNYRDFNQPKATTKLFSRGSLVKSFLDQNLDSTDFLNELSKTSKMYEPFNLLLYDGITLIGFESINKKIIHIQPGISSITNGNFDSNWKKSSRLESFFHNERINKISDQSLFRFLHDQQKTCDEDLPSTGLPLPLERELSSIFINTPSYGTRSSSIVRFYKSDIFFSEKTFNFNGFSEFVSIKINYQRESGNSILTSNTSKLS